jgi:glycosyltransferase involved in cell wall biosynthesis
MGHEPKRILFIHYGENAIRGSERCLLDLVHFLDRKIFTPVVWCNSECMAREVEKLNVKVIQTDFEMLLCGNHSQFEFGRFYKLIKTGLQIVTNENIDLIHSNSGAPNQWMNIVARIRGLPLLSHLHARYPLRERLALGLLWPSLTVGVSQSVTDQLIRDGLDSRFLKVIPNGVDTELQDQLSPVDIRKLLSIPGEQHVIMTAASLIRRKGIDLLIRATSHLLSYQAPVHLVIAGTGPELASLEGMVDEYDLGANVHFLGECRNLPALLRGGVDVFVSGSREEVFGLVLAEANLASVPVVAPRVGGISSVIEHEKTGLLVKPECALSIARAVRLLLNQPGLRGRYGEAGREKVLREFNMENYIGRFESTYLDLIDNRHRHLRWFDNVQVKLVLNMGFRCFRIYLAKWRPAIRSHLAVINPVYQKKS